MKFLPNTVQIISPKWIDVLDAYSVLWIDSWHVSSPLWSESTHYMLSITCITCWSVYCCILGSDISADSQKASQVMILDIFLTYQVFFIPHCIHFKHYITKSLLIFSVIQKLRWFIQCRDSNNRMYMWAEVVLGSLLIFLCLHHWFIVVFCATWKILCTINKWLDEYLYSTIWNVYWEPQWELYILCEK